VSQPQLSERAERLRGAADDAARLAQNLYLSFLLLGTYIAVILGSTTDVQLLKISPVVLPLLNVQLPIVGFYVFVPWLLLLLYFNLLLHLTFLAQKLHRFNAVMAVLTDKVAREDQYARLFPFPFSAMLIGQPAQWRLRGLLGLMVGTTVVLLPLGLLLWAQLRFLPYHSEAITWNHRAAVLGDLVLLWLFWPLILIQESRGGAAAQDFPVWREEPHYPVAWRAVRMRRLRWGTGLICLTLVTVVFSLGIAVLPEEAMEVWMASHVPDRWRQASPDRLPAHTPDRWWQANPDRSGNAVFMLTVWLFETPGAPFHRNLWLQETVLVAGESSAKVIAALQSEDEHKRAQGLEEITGLTLTNRDLRRADLRDTLFAKGDLRGANLKDAHLVVARVFAGNLSSFLLSKGGRCVSDAQQSEDLGSCRTNLQGANLGFAQLQGANLQNAQLQGANLQNAQLQGADLLSAQLQGANLQNARLPGASLYGVQLQGANLQGAQLQGANLQNALIGSADFTRADLTLSNLRALSRLPLDKESYEELEKSLTHAISDKQQRAHRLKQIKAVIGRPAQLKVARSADQVLCDNVYLFRSCLTQEKIAVYAHSRAAFLVELGCHNTVIARSVATLHEHPGSIPIQMAFAKNFAATPEKDCPGWAALPADQKDRLRKLAAGETSAP
jgi:uncharacterized protein YjbI with pentapeptide repeats